MAEIRVAPERRSRPIILIVIAVVILAGLVWYFLMGPGVSTATGG
jgi:hypothetical protein